MATELDLLNHTAPDSELFLIRFPLFAPVDVGLIQMALIEAGVQVDTAWQAAHYQMAIMYLAAHNLYMEGYPQRATDAAPGAGSAVAPGALKKSEVGDVVTEYHAPSVATSGSAAADNIAPTASELQRSHYGRSYAKLLRINRGMPRVMR